MPRRIAILSIAIICMFAAYALMPKREFSLGIFPLQHGATLEAYDDQADGGTSSVAMNVEDSALDFRCTLGTDTSKGAWCGMIWRFEEPDSLLRQKFESWKFVDSVHMDVEAFAESEIIAKVWIFDPVVTNRDSLHTYRQMLKEIPLKKGRNHISIAFKDFYVPDFWFAQTGADREREVRIKNHIARFEITPGWNAPRGVSQHFRFLRIEARGLGSIELAIFIGVCVVIIVLALGFIRKRR